MGSYPLGITPHPAVLLDDRARPDFRDVFGTLASQSTDIAIAITRVRLSTMNLTESELRSVVHFRVLVAEMNAIQLAAEARGLVNDPARAPRLPLLQRMLESGRLQVRAAPLAGWSPDFTVFADAAGPTAVLTGFTGSSVHTHIAARRSPPSTSRKARGSRVAGTRSSGGRHTTSGPQSGASFPRPSRLGPS